MDALFSEEVLSDFHAFEAEYCTSANVEGIAIEVFTSDSEEEEETLEHEPRSSVDDSVHIEEDEETRKERLAVENFLRCTCKCSLGVGSEACSTQFTSEEMSGHRERCLSLEKSELDLVVMSQFQALGKDVPAKTSKETKRSKYIEFCFKGRRICRKTFIFLHTLSEKRYRNLLEHFCNCGLVLREHGSHRQAPHNRMPFAEVQAIVQFLKALAATHAIPLPGRLPGHKDKALLLPSDMSKRSVYRQYVKACSDAGRPHISWAKFHSLWLELVPDINTIRPATDLCFECQKYSNMIVKSANLSEDEKSERLRAAEAHLLRAKMQRTHYNEQCSKGKAEKEKVLETTSSAGKYSYMHYSFDYAQTVHYPSNPQQPGPAYFKSARKCGIFGVTCEPLSFQVNYLIDEDDDPGKGANATISMIDHFLSHHGVHETNLSLHADNCVGQNKNNILMHYLLWRVMTGLNSTITLSFMLVGHTKFAPDRFFGLIKRRYRRTPVYSINDMVNVVVSSTVAGGNTAQLTKDVNGEKQVIWRDWKSFLSCHFHPIPKITTYHHFRFASENPGKVFLKEFADSTETVVGLCNTDADLELDPDELPEEIQPSGMDLKRRWYLYEEIRPFCLSSKDIDLTCPCPSQPKPGRESESGIASNRKRKHGQPEPGTKSKRKRTCSHCHQEGHTKTKKGKLTCPVLVSQ